MELVPPQLAIGMEGHQQGPLGLHQAGCHQGHQLQEAVEVGETTQGKGQGGQQLLVAALLPAEAVEQLAQGSRCRGRGGKGIGRGLNPRRLAAQGGAAMGPAR